MANSFIVQPYRVHPSGAPRPETESEFYGWLIETVTVFAPPVSVLEDRQSDYLLELAIKQKEARDGTKN